MTGRGRDQILRHPGDPRLYESWATSAADYVRLAEGRSGPIPRKVKNDYIWEDLLTELDCRRCDLRVINLETAITAAATPAPKGINYRMSPANFGVLTAAQIDACTLANNHVLDLGEAGLLETLDTPGRERIACAGAGRDAQPAGPATVLPVQGGGAGAFARLWCHRQRGPAGLGGEHRAAGGQSAASRPHSRSAWRC